MAFLQAGLDKLLRHSAKDEFRTRSIQRDKAADYDRIQAVLAVIDTQLAEAEREHAGLARRVEEALARAAVTFGNGTDEYLEREALDNHHQDLLAAEVSNGERRLQELSSLISHLKFLRGSALGRFADVHEGRPVR